MFSVKQNKKKNTKNQFLFNSFVKYKIVNILYICHWKLPIVKKKKKHFNLLFQLSIGAEWQCQPNEEKNIKKKNLFIRAIINDLAHYSQGTQMSTL